MASVKALNTEPHTQLARHPFKMTAYQRLHNTLHPKHTCKPVNIQLRTRSHFRAVIIQLSGCLWRVTDPRPFGGYSVLNAVCSAPTAAPFISAVTQPTKHFASIRGSWMISCFHPVDAFVTYTSPLLLSSMRKRPWSKSSKVTQDYSESI